MIILPSSLADFIISIFLVKLSGSISRNFVNSLATYRRPSFDHSPNQSITQRLKRAGELAVRFEKSGLEGFIVNTT
jgi:hypothetical protein